MIEASHQMRTKYEVKDGGEVDQTTQMGVGYCRCSGWINDEYEIQVEDDGGISDVKVGKKGRGLHVVVED